VLDGVAAWADISGMDVFAMVIRGDTLGRKVFVDQTVSVPLITMPLRRIGTLQRPDCRIHYEVTGAGPAIVFAHGLGGNHLSWWQQVAHFAPNYTCVTFAHRGFAPSSPLGEPPNPADYADDLAALIAHLGLADVRLVAQSMGGWSCVEYALRRPAGLKGVVLGATTGTIDPGKLPEADQPALAAWEAASARARAAFAEHGVHPACGWRMAAEQPALHLLYRHIDDMNAGLDKETMRQRLWAGRVRAPVELGGVACPILMIANDEDTVIPPMAADGIARVVPAARVAHVAEAGHSAYFQRPATYNALVEEFLTTLG
jgi:3-oxoadipate enol-lactonase